MSVIWFWVCVCVCLQTDEMRETKIIGRERSIILALHQLHALKEEMQRVMNGRILLLEWNEIKPIKGAVCQIIYFLD